MRIAAVPSAKDPGHEQPTAFSGESGERTAAFLPPTADQRDGMASGVLHAALCKPEEVALRHSAVPHPSAFGAAPAAPTNKRTHIAEEADPNDCADSLLTAGQASRSAAPQHTSSWVSMPRTKKDRLLLRPAKQPLQQPLAAQQQESEPQALSPSAAGVQATPLITPSAAEALGTCTSPSSTAAPVGALLEGAPHGTTASGLRSGAQMQAQVQVGEQLLGAIIAGLRQIDDPGAVSVAAAAMASAAAAGSSPSAVDMAAAGATLHLQLQALVDHQQDHQSQQPPQELQRATDEAPPAKRWRQQRQAEEGPAAGATWEEAAAQAAREPCPHSGMPDPMDVSVSPRLQAMSVSGAAALGPSVAPSGSLPSRPGASSRASGHGAADTCHPGGTDSVRQGPGRGCLSAAGSGGISGTTTGVTGPGRPGDMQQHTSRPLAALACSAALCAPGVGSLGRNRPEHGGPTAATADTAWCGAAEAAERGKRLQVAGPERGEAERVRQMGEHRSGTAGGVDIAPQGPGKQQQGQQQAAQDQQLSPGDAVLPQVPVKKSKVRIIQPISRTWVEEVQTKAGVLPGPSLDLPMLVAAEAPAGAPPAAAATARAGSGSLEGGSNGARAGAGAGAALERQGSLQSGARTVSPRALGLAAPSHAPARQAPGPAAVAAHAPLHAAERAAASAGLDSAPASLLALRCAPESQRRPADADAWQAARSSPPGPSAPLPALATGAAVPSSKPLGTSVSAAAAAMALQAAAGKRASPEAAREGHVPVEAGGKRPRLSPLRLEQLHPATSAPQPGAPPQLLIHSDVPEAKLRQELLLRMLPGLLTAGGVPEAGLAIGEAAAGSVPLTLGTAALTGPPPHTQRLIPPNPAALEQAGTARVGAVADELREALPRAALGTGVGAAALLQQLLAAAPRGCPPNASLPGPAVQLLHADAEGSPFSTGAAPSVAGRAGALPLPYAPQPTPLLNAASHSLGSDADRHRTDGNGGAAARRVSASGPFPSSLLCPGPTPAVPPALGSKPQPLSDVLSLLLLGAGSSAAPADSASPLVSQVLRSDSEHQQQQQQPHWQQQIDALRRQLLQQPEPRPSSLRPPARRAASARQLRGPAGPAALHPLPANTAPGGGPAAEAPQATALVVRPPGEPLQLSLRRQVSAPLPGALRDLQAAPPQTLGAVQGELTLLYQWYVANKSVYMDLARHHLERVEALTAVAAASAEATTAAAVGSAASGGGSPAALAAAVSATEAVARVRSESAEAMRAFDMALHIMRACSRVEQQWSVPQRGPGVAAPGAAAAGPQAIRGSAAPGDAGPALLTGLRGVQADVGGGGGQALLALELAGPGGSGFGAGGAGSLQGRLDSGAWGPGGPLGPPGGLAGGVGAGEGGAGGPHVALAVAAALVQAAAQQSPAAAAAAGAGALDSQAARGGMHAVYELPCAGSLPAGLGAAAAVRGASPGAL